MKNIVSFDAVDVVTRGIGWSQENVYRKRMNATSIIECKNLSRRWAEQPVFRNVELRVERGEYLSISGPSGAGKSTLLRVFGTLDRKYQGTLSLFGQSVDDASDRALALLRNQRISFVFQSHQLLPHLRAKENILLPWAFRRGAKNRELPYKRLDALLNGLGLGDKADAFPDALSGGQQQRVAIARALITEPELLLCDELTGNLDRATADRVMDVIEAYREASGCTLIVVSHDPQVVRRADTHYRIDDGRLQRSSTDASSSEREFIEPELLERMVVDSKGVENASREDRGDA